MIKISDLVPRIYSTSPDMNIFFGIFDCIFNAVDSKIPAVRGLHSPRNCYEENLRHLAKNFNLDTANRNLIDNYRMMVKNKGTEKVLEAVLFFCGAENLQIEAQLLEDAGGGNLLITANIGSEEFNYPLFDVLAARVLPFNCQIRVIPNLI